MQRIAMDTIGPFPEVTTFKFIIVLIDTFTRFVELFPSQTVSATSAANALWRHICRFCTPIEIMTDRGSQFMNQTLTHLTTISGIRHHLSIPYSKEENGIVERANKEVNRHIRNILADTDCIHEWPQMLCMTEKLLNSSIKQTFRGVTEHRPFRCCYTNGAYTPRRN
jgi:transposase InsO family protein